MRIRPGSFITVEGGEAVGKSTQIARLAATLRAAGHNVVLTREPGGTQGAEAIRAVMLDPATSLAPLADTLLVFAARADHVATLIRPALARGDIVLCDRFTDSTMAYQGYGLGIDGAIIATLTGMIGLTPDLTLILETPPAIAAARLAARTATPDRYERFDAQFGARVAAGFRAIAAADPARCALIDASGPIDAIAATIAATIAQRLAP
ncbi:dTMP kinase [Acidiphilium sp. PA]|uniref:dTMP kinase n=1 Tax=Acidiphilium sp. PA TaxID=2871705 RepID=UPI00224455EC|nr:dTMP kinase [Acidiphilium sp. PA]MCW8308279.1 dTMP kinase [Acidiphilium sp. PA]